MKTTNYCRQQLAERLFWAACTTVAVMGISALHDNLERSLVNTLFSSNLRPATATLPQLSNPLTDETMVALTCSTAFESFGSAQIVGDRE